MVGAIVAQDRHHAMGIKAIETRAYGRLFRSRTEARWAVAFTEADISWQYELEGFDLGDAGFYLPDFWLPQVNMWAEVKPNRPTDQEIIKAHALVKQSGNPCLLLIGQPAAHAYWAIEDDSRWITATIDGQDIAAHDYCPFEGSDYHLDEGRFYGNCAASGTFPMPFDPGFGSHPAVEAALSARFE
jgi:hypothetical protein